MKTREGALFRSLAARVAVALVLGFPAMTAAADVTRPEAVSGLQASRSGDDVQLSWPDVTLDAAGHAEAIDHYAIYRGESPDFVPDRAGGSNRIGTSSTTSFPDLGAAADPQSYFYLVSAVDAAGNESNTEASSVTSPPALDGSWTSTTIELSWTHASPQGEVASYRVYYGRASGQYEFVADVGLATAHSLAGLQRFVNWYAAVTAIDASGNESPFSNEHIDAVNGIVRHRVHDAEEVCWGAGDCTPADPAKIQRNDGFQILVPTHFPEGEWVSVIMNVTVESRLCTPPAQGTVSKCGSNNPGGYNPCGDPWDRLGQVFLVLDDCIETGGNCLTPNNLELMRLITPFGTDADPPDGTGVVPPRRLTLDVTPFAPLLVGDKYLGAEIVHFVQRGWWITVDFVFSEKPEQASSKPPADGIEIIGLGGAPLPAKQVAVPPTATEVKLRLFTSGHGGSLFCDGGTNDAEPCTINGSNAECPGGICNPCDEFCHRTNRILVDGVPVWTAVPWRSDCSPGPPCSTWNACGTTSCIFPRAGWCPGYVACHHDAPCDNDLDFTPLLPAGGTYDIGYDVTPQNGSWPVSLVLFWYE